MFTTRTRQMRLCSRLLSLILFVVILLTASAHAQSQPQVDLTGKNVLVLHAFEANMPINVKTDKGLMAAAESTLIIFLIFQRRRKNSTSTG